VRTALPGASTEETEAEVSQKIEEAVNTVEGIQELRSVSSGGTSFVIATFNLSRDIDTAAQDIRDRVSAVVRQLPDDALPPVIAKFNNDTAPVMTVALSGNRSLKELTEVADKVVKVQLERSTGVGEVQIVGGLERAMSIWVDADRLAAYKIPITEVRDALVRQNSNVPGGNVTTALEEKPLRTLGRVQQHHRDDGDHQCGQHHLSNEFASGRPDRLVKPGGFSARVWNAHQHHYGGHPDVDDQCHNQCDHAGDCRAIRPGREPHGPDRADSGQ